MGGWMYAGVLFLLFNSSIADTVIRDTSSESVVSLVSKLPSCAFECLSTSISVSNCSFTDLSCICASPEFTQAAQDCVLSNCEVEDVLTATRIQRNACGFPVRNASATTRGIAWGFFAAAILCVGLRFLARSPAFKGVGYGWDDWTILVCLILGIPLNILLDIMLDIGLAQDIWMLKPEKITAILHFFFIQEFIYSLLVLLNKISILLMYFRLFPRTEKWFRYGCIGAITLTAVTVIPGWLTILFQCSPIEYAWLRWDGKHSGTCINTTAQIIGFAGINILLDLVAILLPIPRLMKLQIGTSKKFGVTAIFALGLFVTVCSVVRIQYLSSWGTSQNPTWQYNAIAIWSSLECNLGIVCACLPLFAGPIKRIWKKAIGSVMSSSNPSSSGFRQKKRDTVWDVGAARNRHDDDTKSFPRGSSARYRLDSTSSVELVDREADVGKEQQHDA